ncbi:MAG: ATP-binding cassette domain-containing protein [Candidatus Omnitrophica bacterium]|nr:ATP-binding cassette domain-containing protein [Candidatus Omnitrophota bacterium]
MDPSQSPPFLQLQGIHKSFGGIQALSGIDLDVREGEIHGLVGENGAGKSTLINIATGVHQPTEGKLLVRGESIHFANPHEATAAGIAVVHQEAELFAKLSLAENMLLGPGLPRGPLGWVKWGETYRIAEEALSEIGENFPVRTRAGSLSIAQRVLAQIASALHQEARVLFLDEPTASLTDKESKTLFEQIRRLKEKGVAIVYVSHRLEEVLELSDRITVLRDGTHIWTRPRDQVSLPEMVTAMVGREMTDQYPEKRAKIGEPVFTVESLSDDEEVFEGLNLEVRSGEILGLYGLIGAGRSEFAQTLFGIRKRKNGRAHINGKPFQAKTPTQALHQGLAYLPEDRLNQGVFRELTVRENAAMAVLRRLSNLTFVSGKREKASTQRVMDQTRVKAQSPETPISNLSGGNQQKVVLGRWLETEPEVLILDEPTRGVDVGAKAEIHKLIGELSEKGKAVIMISSDLPEVMAMSDRIAVFCEGRITGEFNPQESSAEEVAVAAFPSAETETEKLEAAPASKWDLSRFREAGIGAALLAMVIVMGAVKPESFLHLGNFVDILSSVAILSVAALGATFVIGAGGIDISVGSMLGLIGAVTGTVALNGWPVPVCLLIAIGLGAFLGLVNSGASLLGNVHPIIVTLAGLSIYRGLMRQFTGGYEISNLPDSYRALGDGLLWGVPRVVWFAVAVFFLAWILLQRLQVGRQMLAVGNSKTAAAQIGLPIHKLSLLSFAINGAFIGLASVLWGAYYGKLQTNAGEGLELQAIAAAVIGGVHIMGGTGTAVGTFLGACLIGVINNSLSLLKVNPYWQPVFIGIFILVTVLLDSWITRRSERRAKG